MNRFLLFAFDQYYPNGGMDDCVFMSNDPDEVVRQWKLHGDHSHVYDCESGRQYEGIEEFVAKFG